MNSPSAPPGGEMRMWSKVSLRSSLTPGGPIPSENNQINTENPTKNIASKTVSEIHDNFEKPYS